MLANDERAAHDVAVTAEILGARVHHQIRAEFERSLPDRRRERVVAADERAALAAHLRDERSMSLMFSIGFDGVSIQTSRVCGVSAARTASSFVMSTNVCAHAHRPDDFAQLRCGAVIGLDRRDDVIARTQQAKHGERRGGARSVRGCVSAAFQRRDALLERRSSRIAGARVRVAARELTVGVALKRGAQCASPARPHPLRTSTSRPRGSAAVSIFMLVCAVTCTTDTVLHAASASG